MWDWCHNVLRAVVTVAHALWTTLRCWLITYRPERKTFTEQYEYPELPAVLAPRFRGFHRYDVQKCIACERCARDCPAQCIYIAKRRSVERKGFQATSFVIDYGKCLLCGICTENCPADCIFMGACYDLSCYSREGCVVDFVRLPPEIARGRDTLNPTVVALSKTVDWQAEEAALTSGSK